MSAGFMCAAAWTRHVQRGRELISLLESGGLDGLSIGFRTVSAAREKLTAHAAATEH